MQVIAGSEWLFLGASEVAGLGDGQSKFEGLLSALSGFAELCTRVSGGGFQLVVTSARDGLFFSKPINLLWRLDWGGLQVVVCRGLGFLFEPRARFHQLRVLLAALRSFQVNLGSLQKLFLRVHLRNLRGAEKSERVFGSSFVELSAGFRTDQLSLRRNTLLSARPGRIGGQRLIAEFRV